MIRFLAMLAMVAASLCVPAHAGDQRLSLKQDGHERTWQVHVPARLPEDKRPLVLVLHGGGGNGENAVHMSGMSAVADREGFYVAYPNGSGRLTGKLLTWNAGNCCGYALDKKTDDVAFIRQLIDRMTQQYPVDSRRIYVSGMSNGGMMTYRLACELTDRIAAVAVISGAMNMECRAHGPLSVIALHGADDQHVPYAGGVPTKSVDRRHPRSDRAVMDTMEYWAKHNACAPASRRDLDAQVVVNEWRGCAAGTDVALYTLKGFGHAWPGGERGYAGGDSTESTLRASDVAWEFFKRHARTGSP